MPNPVAALTPPAIARFEAEAKALGDCIVLNTGHLNQVTTITPLSPAHAAALAALTTNLMDQIARAQTGLAEIKKALAASAPQTELPQTETPQ